MGFTVITDSGLDEDGELVPANAYISVADFLAYWADRGQDYTDYDGEVIQAQLVKATDYIERRFGHRWKGLPAFTGQPLAWPRLKVVLRHGEEVGNVPKAVRHACAEYAQRSLLGATLWPDPTVAGNVRKTVQAIGPIRTETEYLGGGGAELPEFPTADYLLRPYLNPAGGVER